MLSVKFGAKNYHYFLFLVLVTVYQTFFASVGNSIKNLYCAYLVVFVFIYLLINLKLNVKIPKLSSFRLQCVSLFLKCELPRKLLKHLCQKV